MSNNNRHPRDVEIVEEQSESSLGFVVDIVDDDPRLEDGREPDEMDLQIKPHPNGYQYTLWWEEDGKRKQRDGVIPFSDPRDEV